MASRTLWNPWIEMRRLQREMEQMFGDVAPAWRWPLTGDYPPVNVINTEEGVRVEALCPGIDRNTVDITVVGDSLTLRCERTLPEDVPGERYQRRERPIGAFKRTIGIGDRLDTERTQAVYRNGVLRIDLRRAAETAPRKIQIQS